MSYVSTAAFDIRIVKFGGLSYPSKVRASETVGKKTRVFIKPEMCLIVIDSQTCCMLHPRTTPHATRAAARHASAASPMASAMGSAATSTEPRRPNKS
eukprot:scaffold6269_cov113-Isochrysis_galbana.AAC.3